MLATITSASLSGIDAVPVQVEVNTGEGGEPAILLVGLPDTAVRESCDRVTSAMANSGFKMPWSRTTINLAPGNIRKEGPLYDLPIALAMLAATGELKSPGLDQLLISGELGLAGTARPVRGALAMARLARKLGKSGIMLPPISAAEAALVEGLSVFEVESLHEAFEFLSGRKLIEPLRPNPARVQRPPANGADFSEVKGQHTVRRAVEVAVAGGHNLLLLGPPGAGKSMIAKRIPSVLPAPPLEEYLEILTIHSAAGKTLSGELVWGARPFRSPHHTISDIGLLGGGSIPGPGEVSLAHNGVLFLDELPEFKRSALEVLRQPLEDREVTISRSAGKITLPCSFMLIAAMNPCPCGYLGDPRRECRCSPSQVQKYRNRISGPLLDRIDLQVEAPAVSFAELRSENGGESSAVMRGRIEAARARQSSRLRGTALNSRMSHSQTRAHCRITPELGDLLQRAMEELKLSARAYDRILKVARTIADLGAAEQIDSNHLLEAIQYRSLDRTIFY